MKDLGDLNNWTKNDLSRVIVQALMNLDEPARADSAAVKNEMRKPKARLVEFAAHAIEIISRRYAVDPAEYRGVDYYND